MVVVVVVIDVYYLLLNARKSFRQLKTKDFEYLNYCPLVKLRRWEPAFTPSVVSNGKCNKRLA
jgi:hypothetical protein